MRAACLLMLALVVGCLGGERPGDVGFRIENRAEAAYGLHVEFAATTNQTPVYEVDVIVRRGEVGTHVAPLADAAFVVRAEVTRGPGPNSEADDNTLPPATTTSRVETNVDGSTCETPALAEIVLRDGGALASLGQSCLA